MQFLEPGLLVVSLIVAFYLIYRIALSHSCSISDKKGACKGCPMASSCKFIIIEKEGANHDNGTKY